MNEKEKQLAAKFLEELSDRLANDGCNDWEFPVGWSLAERIVFVSEFHAWNGDPENFNINAPNITNDAAASFLAHKLTT
jgi:hypothetical protein